jgi:large subunit ribosomal protein L25
MKIVSISGSLRENVGKKDAKMLRNNGQLPAVMYGGEKQFHFAIDAKEFKKFIFTPEIFFIEIEIEGEKYRTILKDVHYHPVSDNALHADFLQIFDDKAIVMNVPFSRIGASIGVMKGGVAYNGLRKLKVLALPANMPDHIEVDITKIDLGQSVKVRDLEIENAELLDDRNAIVCGVNVPRTQTAIISDEDEDEEGSEAAAEE